MEHKDNFCESSQSCNLTRKQGHDLVVKGAIAIREGKDFVADGLKLSASGFIELLFWGASKIFMGIKEDDYKHL